MQENASSSVETAPKRRRNLLPIFVFIFTMILFTAFTGGYYLLRYVSNNSQQETPSVLSAKDVQTEDWQRFEYDDAQISFDYPAEFSAEEIANGLLITQEGSEVLKITYADTGIESLSTLSKAENIGLPELVKQNNKLGFKYINNQLETYYFPLELNKYVKLQTLTSDEEIEIKIYKLIDSLEFLAPLRP